MVSMLYGMTHQEHRESLGSHCHRVSRRERRCRQKGGSERAAVNRYYDPVTGQFMSVDPMVAQTQQAYVYTSDDPLNETDPLGLKGCGWNPICYIGSGYDKVNNALNFILGTAAGWICAADRQAIICSSSSTGRRVTAGRIVWDPSELPPLRLLHPQSTLESTSNYGYWLKQSTSDILRSLLPAQDGSLLAKSDGTILDGNTRVSVLKGRGVDVNSLPREVYDPSADFPLGEGFDFEGE